MDTDRLERRRKVEHQVEQQKVEQHRINERHILERRHSSDELDDSRGVTERIPARPNQKKQKRKSNNVRKLRMERMMSKAELARRAGISTLTVDRIEKGMPCRMDTKRKILEALSLTPADRVAVFGEEE